MTRFARAVVLGLVLTPLGCPLLRDDDFVLVDAPSPGLSVGGAPSPPHDEEGQAGASDCDVENWSGRGALPRGCAGKPPK
jgi:hypothetical protein